LNLADKVVLFGAPPWGAATFDGTWEPRAAGRPELGGSPDRATRDPVEAPPPAWGRGGAGRGRARRAIESQKREKPPRGATPGGLRIRLLMKETVRGPLGESLLLGIGARIGAGSGCSDCRDCKRREGEHATARGRRGRRGRRGSNAANRRETEGRARETRAIGPMPLRDACAAGDRPPAHDLATEHGQARGRLRFRRDVEEGEDHGTVAAALLRAAASRGPGMGDEDRVALGRRSRPKRHSTCTSGLGDVQVFKSTKRSNERLVENDIK
jgi:hypothetical protein